MNIGLIGVGTMGLLVARTLVEAGHELVAYDANPQALQGAKAAGARLADSASALAAAVDLTLLLLPGPRQIEAVVAGDRGVLQAAAVGHVIIDMSTSDPATTRRLGARAAEAGVDYLDAPILGRPGSLGHWLIPVGGEAEKVDRCRAVLGLLAREVIHVGPLGSGHTLKLLNALMFSAINAMTAEMMVISAKAGLPPGMLFDTISASEAATVSGLFKEVGAKIVSRDFEPTFSVKLLCKDNSLAIAMARDCGAPPVLASAIQTINELGKAQGYGDEDTSALVKVYESLLGTDAATTNT